MFRKNEINPKGKFILSPQEKRQGHLFKVSSKGLERVIKKQLLYSRICFIHLCKKKTIVMIQDSTTQLTNSQILWVQIELDSTQLTNSQILWVQNNHCEYFLFLVGLTSAFSPRFVRMKTWWLLLVRLTADPDTASHDWCRPRDLHTVHCSCQTGRNICNISVILK